MISKKTLEVTKHNLLHSTDLHRSGPSVYCHTTALAELAIELDTTYSVESVFKTALFHYGCLLIYRSSCWHQCLHSLSAQLYLGLSLEKNVMSPYGSGLSGPRSHKD